MRYFIVVLLVSASLTSQCMAQDKASYIGRLNPPFPDECTHKESGLLGEGITAAYTRASCNGKEVLWLESFVKLEGKEAIWQIVDEIIFPDLAQDKVLDVQYCSLKNNKQFAIAAAGYWVKARDGSYYAKPIVAAWKLNHLRLKIEPISPKKVICEYEEID